jgi:type II secretory ATPase GspE/PulE/Tfp pilus assembly ATPase PilB-like protein
MLAAASHEDPRMEILMLDGPIGALGAILAQAQDVPQGGYYFSAYKIALLVVLVLPWLYFAPWVNNDATRVRTRQGLWSAVVLGGGIVGLILWLLVPYYILGLSLYVVLAGAGYAAYIVHRNSRVPQDAKVLTMAHISSLRGPRTARVQPVSKIKLYGHDVRAGVIPTPDANTDGVEKVEAYNMAQELLYDIIRSRASEADLFPSGQASALRYIIDGILVDREPIPAAKSESLIQFLKPMANMNAEDRRRPQQGKISVDVANRPVDIELTCAGSTGGQRMQFKVVQEAIKTNLQELGMSPDVLKRIREINSVKNGLIIVSSRPRNGLTSTLYSLLKEQDVYIKQVVTLEAKPPIDLENVTQNVYRQNDALAAGLASALRRDPDVIVLDDCPDEKTAQLIAQGASEKLILLGSQAADTFMALAKWVKICNDPKLAVADLRAVLCQVLVRRLCPACREAYKPDPQMLAKVNISAQHIADFYRPPTKPLLDDRGGPLLDNDGEPLPCPTCQGSGYFGRTAVFELLEVTDEIKQLVIANTPLSQIRAAARKNKMLYLQEQALQKVVEGVTGVAEVLRVSQPAKKA